MRCLVFYVLLHKFIKNAERIHTQYATHVTTLLGLDAERIGNISTKVLPNKISLIVPLAGDRSFYIDDIQVKLLENYQSIREKLVDPTYEDVDLDVAERTLLQCSNVVKTHQNFRGSVDQMAKGISGILSSATSDDIGLSCPKYSKETIENTLKTDNRYRFDQLTLLHAYKTATSLQGDAEGKYWNVVYEPYDVLTFAWHFESDAVTSWINNNYVLRKRVQDFNAQVYNAFSIRLFETEQEYSLLDDEKRNAYVTHCSGITEPSNLVNALFDTFKRLPNQLIEKKRLLDEYLSDSKSLFNSFYFSDAKLTLAVLSYDLIRNVVLQLSQMNMRLYTETYDLLKKSAEEMNKNQLSPARNEIEKLINMDNSFEWITRPENFGLIMPDNTLMSQIDSAWLDVKKYCKGFKELDFMPCLLKNPDSDFWITFGKYVATLYKKTVQTSGRQYSTIKLMDSIQRDLNGAIQELSDWRAIRSSSGVIFEYKR